MLLFLGGNCDGTGAGELVLADTGDTGFGTEFWDRGVLPGVEPVCSIVGSVVGPLNGGCPVDAGV